MKNKLLLVMMACVLSLAGAAQTSPPKDSVLVANPKADTDEVYIYADEMPQYPGGETGFWKFLQENIVYPEAEKKNKKEGSVFVQFTVEKDGSITDVQVMKGVPGAPGLSAEAVRVIKMMPPWKPATHDGKIVRVKMLLPVKFVLDAKRTKKSN